MDKNVMAVGTELDEFGLYIYWATDDQENGTAQDSLQNAEVWVLSSHSSKVLIGV